MNKFALACMASMAFTGFAQGAAAQDSAARAGGSASPWYIGAGIGFNTANIPKETVNSIDSTLSTANGATFSVVDKDNRSGATKVFVGYTFYRYFAVEAGYAALGRSKVNMDFRNGLVSVGVFNLEYKMSAAFIDAVGLFPVTDKLSLIGRLGVNYGRTTVEFDGSPTTLIASNNDKAESKVREKFGAGIDYSFNPAFSVRAEWERYKLPDPLSDARFNVDAGTLSLLYHF